MTALAPPLPKDDRLAALEVRVVVLEAALKGMRTALLGGSDKGPPVQHIAPARDLDGQYGNEEIRFVPKGWTGPSFKGHRMSECSPEFLDTYAEVLEYFATQADAKGEMVKDVPKSKYDRRVASRARGWAERLRGGWVPPKPRDPDAAPAWADDMDDLRF